MIRNALLVAATLVVILAAPVCAAADGLLVVLPFENASTSLDATREVMPLIIGAVEKRGWKVVPAEQIEALLEEQRVRYLGSLDETVLRACAERLGASEVLAGTIYTFRPDQDVPMVGLSARLIQVDGAVRWGDVASLTGYDTESVFGFGRTYGIQKLTGEAVERLMERFPEPGGKTQVARGEGAPLFRGAAATFRSIELPEGQKHRVCILPFESPASGREASRLVEEILALRLSAREDFEVVEPAAFRRAMRDEGLRSFRGAGREELRALGRRLDTTLFLSGGIYEYRDVPRGGARIPPELQIELTLVDVATAKVLWTATLYRRGDDYEGLLLRGAISNGVTLVDRVVSELIDSAEGAHLKGISSDREVARGRAVKPSDRLAKKPAPQPEPKSTTIASTKGEVPQ